VTWCLVYAPPLVVRSRCGRLTAWVLAQRGGGHAFGRCRSLYFVYLELSQRRFRRKAGTALWRKTTPPGRRTNLQSRSAHGNGLSCPMCHFPRPPGSPGLHFYLLLLAVAGALRQLPPGPRFTNSKPPSMSVRHQHGRRSIWDYTTACSVVKANGHKIEPDHFAVVIPRRQTLLQRVYLALTPSLPDEH